MSKFIDLTGQTFGNWKVIERAESKKYDNGKSATMWLCQCQKQPLCFKKSTPSELKKSVEPTCRGCKYCHNLDLTGMIFGRWNVISKADDYIDCNNRIYHMWNCECSCKNHTKKIVSAHNLIRGTSKSCGCIASEYAKTNFIKHNGAGTRLYNIWNKMKDRCTNPNCPAFHNYGGRGITFCEEWKDFSIFREWAYSHGYSEELTIDRIDNNGNYSPDNCRWITMKEQANNTRRTRYFEVDGVEKTLSEWSNIYSVPSYEILFRIKNGWDVKKAITTPLRKLKKVVI